MMKTLAITIILAALALWFYHFNLIDSLHLYLIPLVINLFIFGWSLGIFTSSLVIRWGHAAEALIWGVPFLVQPLSAIFYPLSVLPPWLQVISKTLPSTHVFEGMRSILVEGRIEPHDLVMAFGLNAVYFLLAGLFFQWMYSQARRSGRLGRLGTD
jgi:ABC-2 type transport system permease protein